MWTSGKLLQPASIKCGDPLDQVRNIRRNLVHGYRRIQNVLKVFAKLITDDDKGLFHFEWSDDIKCTYIKVHNLFE